MCRRLNCPASFALVLSLILVSIAQADLIGWWTFDEGSGTTAYDTSGNGHDGTLLGTGEWGSGPFGAAALEFGTDKCTGINCGVFDPTGGTPEFTLALWAYWDGTPAFSYHFLTKSNGWAADTMMFQVELWADDSRPEYTERVGISYQGNSPGSVPFGVMPKNEWVHLAWIFDGTNATVYMNGVDDEGPKPFSIGPYVDAPVIIGASTLGATRVFEGFLDDMRLFDYALTEPEIRAIMTGTEQSQLAYGPEPADGALLTDTWANLTWRAGPSAVSHDVYAGDSFDAVSEATHDSDVFQGNQATTTLLVGFPGFAYPDGLEPGTTYYWRIDEVNDADPNSPWKGSVWSFSIAPKTAYNPDPADGAEFVGPDNVTLTWTAGFGAKLHTVYFGEDYDEVSNATAGTVSGTTSYRPGTLEREKVYYWRIDENDGVETYKGDVWTFTTPGAVGNPQPANGATDVAMSTVLSWTSADSAASHQLYLGMNKDTVRGANTSSPEYVGPKTLGDETYDLDLLEANATYYWRVDEVYNGSPLQGPVWSFTVGNYLLVDDFESYTDDDPNNEAIWQHWIDGFGAADNGAQVGYLMPPYAEQTIVHGGSQSMPLSYANEGAVSNSEAALTLTALRDWTAAGVGELSLWFRGASANAAEPLYVAISNSAGAPAIVANDDPAAVTSTLWKQWRVPLQTFTDQGINLTNVDKLAIGLGSKSGLASAGGSGTIYIDDIRLYQP
jgi:hypothetical protein